MSVRYWPVFAGVALSSAAFAASDAGFAFLIKQLTEVVAAGQELSERQAWIKRWLPAAVLFLRARGIGPEYLPAAERTFACTQRKR